MDSIDILHGYIVMKRIYLSHVADLAAAILDYVMSMVLLLCLSVRNTPLSNLSKFERSTYNTPKDITYNHHAHLYIE